MSLIASSSQTGDRRLRRNALPLRHSVSTTLASIAPALSFFFGFSVIVAGSGLAAPLTILTAMVGILFLIGFTLCYMTAVSWADYSFVMPAGAFGYAVQTMLAILVLHEVVSPKRWIGVAMICVGVLLVGQTKPNTTNPGPGVTGL